MEVTNRFKGLDLTEYLKNYGGHDIVQEAVIKTVPPKREMQKGKWLSEEALTKSCEKKRSEGKGQKERHTHLNAEFQRTARKQIRKPSSVINAKK